MYEIINKHARIFVGILFILLAFLLFYRLDTRTFRLWDEARLAINAVNMLRDGNYFYTTYQNAPDFWNTKPHLFILLQVLSIKLFGFTEGSIRLPSAIASLLSCGLIYHWLKKENYSPFYAGLATFAFMGTRFLSYHGARAGDYEALLILCELSYCYAFFEYIQTQKTRFLCFCFTALTLAVLTKGIAGLLFTPGVVIFAFLKRKVEIFLKCKLFYFVLLIFIFCIAGYYWMHEILTPGYLKNVYVNELCGRYFKTVEGHHGGWWFYFNLFSLTNFYFLPVLLVGIVHLLFNRNLWHCNLLLQYICIISLVFFIIISFSKTKLFWYAYPLYPFVGMLTAILSNELSRKLNNVCRKTWLKLLIGWVMLAYVSAVIAMLASTRESSKHARSNMASFLKNNLKYDIPQDYKLIMDDIAHYDASLDFQIERYLAKTQHSMEKVTLTQVHPGDWVIVGKNQANKISFIAQEGTYLRNKNFGVYKMG